MLHTQALFFILTLLSCSDLHSSATFPMYLPAAQTYQVSPLQTTYTHPPVVYLPISSLNHVHIAALSQINNRADYLSSNSRSSMQTDIQSTSTHDRSYYGDPYLQQLQHHAAEQNLAEEKKAHQAVQRSMIQQERAQIRAEKEIVEKFIDSKERAFAKIESETIRPVQWGDYFPITKSLFAYLGWREDETIITLREKLKTELQATQFACQEMKSVIAAALATAGYDKARQTMQFFINNGMNCDQFTDHKKNEPMNQYATYKVKEQENIHAGKREIHCENSECDIFIHLDEKGEYIVGKTIIPKDAKAMPRFEAYANPIPIKNNKNIQHSEFANQHANFANRARQQSYTARMQNIQKIIKQSQQLSPSHQQNINNFLQKWGFNCSDTSSIQINASKNLSIVSFIDGNEICKIGIEPNDIIYVIDRTPIATPTPYQPSPLLPNDHTKVATQTPTSLPPSSSTPQTTAQQNPPQNAPAPVTSNNMSSPATDNAEQHTPTPQPSPAIPAPQTFSPEQAIAASIARNQTSTRGKHPTTQDACNQVQDACDQVQDDTNSNTKKISSEEERRTLFEAQDAWVQNNIHPTRTDAKNKTMLQCMLDTIIEAENDTTIEIAQSGLRAWEQAEKAESDEERAYHLKRFQQYYQTIEYKTPQKSITQQAMPVPIRELESLALQYTTALQEYEQDQAHGVLPDKKTEYMQQVETHLQTLKNSVEQVRQNSLPYRTYELSPQARGFMMANNMNHAAFHETYLTDYQHCLTQQILTIVESSASIANKHDAQSMVGQLVRHNCNLAIAAQQCNQASHLEQATALTNISLLCDKYAQYLAETGDYFQFQIDLQVGLVEGAARAVYKWGEFLKDLGCQPRQTLGKIAADYQALGTALYDIAGKACEFMPHAYLDDMMQDMHESIARFQNNSPPSDANQSSRMAQRTQRNAQLLHDGLCGAVQAGQAIIEDMMQKSVRQNVAMGSEIIVDNMITGKATQALVYVSHIVGNQALKVAHEIQTLIPPHLNDASPIFMTNPNTGQMLAIADITGESIGHAAAAKKLADDIANIAKAAAYAKNAVDKTSNSSGNNIQKTTSSNTYTYKWQQYTKNYK